MMPQQKLEMAALFLKEVSAELNDKLTACEHCKHKVYENFDEKNLKDRLEGAINRIQDVIRYFERKGEVK